MNLKSSHSERRNALNGPMLANKRLVGKVGKVVKRGWKTGEKWLGKYMESGGEMLGKFCGLG